MTSKTKLSIFSVAGIAVIAALASGFIINDNAFEPVSEPATVPNPDATSPWQGVPMLRANEAPAKQESFNAVSTEKFPWLDRVITKGEAIVNDEELEEFFKISDGNFYYLVDSQMYLLSFNHANIRLDQHYVKAFPYDDEKPGLKSANTEANPWLQKATSSPYKWIQISEAEANSFMNFKVTGTDVSTVNSDMRISYVGPLSEEARSLAYQNIVEMSKGDFENEHE